MKDIISYLKIFYEATYLPLCYYENNSPVFQFPETQGYPFMDYFLYLFSQPQKNIDFFITESNVYCGMVRSLPVGGSVFVGPVCTVIPNHSMLLKIMSEFTISTKHKTDIDNFFHITPTFSLKQFLYLMSVLNAHINDELADPSDSLMASPFFSSNAINKNLYSSLYEAKEANSFHNTFQFEQKMCHYIEEGNVERLEKLLQNSYNVHSGIMSETPLRQEKNQFIATITLVTRYSIYGGLDIETAYQLSDTYILECEKNTSTKAISILLYKAILDFARRVSENKIPAGMSIDVFKSIQFISTHTNQPISVTDVADAIGKSTSLISKKFKKELGFNLSDFIMRRKLEEAKSLLAYSEKSISEISEYLCFSSQPYFQTIFKKQYGVTPYNYRKEHRRR